VTDIECGSIVGDLETADDFDYYYSYNTCQYLVLAEQTELDHWILIESRTIAEYRMVETELRDKFLPDKRKDESGAISSIFEVDLYSAVGHRGQAQLCGEDPERLVRYHS
jgi:hypothetical protein